MEAMMYAKAKNTLLNKKISEFSNLNGQKRKKKKDVNEKSLAKTMCHYS